MMRGGGVFFENNKFAIDSGVLVMVLFLQLEFLKMKSHLSLSGQLQEREEK